LYDDLFDEVAALSQPVIRRRLADVPKADERHGLALGEAGDE
jgi:hypothetical protein